MRYDGVIWLNLAIIAVRGPRGNPNHTQNEEKDSQCATGHPVRPWSAIFLCQCGNPRLGNLYILG